MGYKIIFTKKSSLDFKHLDNSVKKKIEKYIDKLIARESPKSIGEQLAENLKAYWKYRIGEYRMVAKIDETNKWIVILVIAHRKEVYKTATTRLN